MKKYLLRVACAAALSLLTVGSSVQAQGVFSPSVNGVRSIYQTRRAAAADSAAQRVVVIVTCSADASMAAIANQMTELKAIVRLVMGDQLMVETTIDKLDAIAAIDGVLLIDIPKPGRQRTDKARKASQVDEVHAGKATGLPDLPQAYTGKGVIIGLIDNGYDFTHPMFKDKDGNLRIKGVYIAADETLRDRGEDIGSIPTTTKTGETFNTSLMGEFITDKDIILDTLLLKDTYGTHGTHCASIAAGTIMNYKDKFTGKYKDSGKLGGMAPEAELYLSSGSTTEDQKKKYSPIKDEIIEFNCMQALYAMKHFADKAGKPLIVSWSENNHGGFHDGTSTMARFIRNYCRDGNVMALCSSNEGDDSMYIDRTISKGKTLKMVAKKSLGSFNTDCYIKTSKEIKVNLAIVDTTFKPVYTCELPLTSKSEAGKDYQAEFAMLVKNNQKTKNLAFNDKYYDNEDSKKLAAYIASGKLTVGVSAAGTGLDKNDQKFDYVNFYIIGEKLAFESDPVTEAEIYKPMLLITSVDEDVRVQGWGDYCSNYANSMDDENTFKPGSSANSMGDWNTSGEPVTIGAYVTDRKVVNPDYPDDSDNPLFEVTREVMGRYASFSSYGRDFSDNPHNYPDVVAPGFAIYAAGNSFKPEEEYQTAEYTGQFKGQSKPREYPYSIMGGTSMSTPAAAGIFALWMQAAIENKDNPNCRFPGKLTNANIKDIIQHSSDTDEFTKKEPLRYGAGKINAYKGLLYLLGLDKTAIGELPTKHIGAKLDGRTLIINGNPDVQVSIYNLSGQKMLDTKAVNGTVELPQLPAGVYAVKIGNQGSTLIRL